MEIMLYFEKTALISLFLCNRSFTGSQHNETKMDVFVMCTQGLSYHYPDISNSHTHTYLV